MIFDILRDKLVAAELGIPGKTLFLNAMPGDVAIGIMLKSPIQGIRIDHELPGYYDPSLQVIVRHGDPVKGAALADQVQRCLTVDKRERHDATAERGAVQINQFLPAHTPIQFPRMNGGGIEWSLNFRTSFAIA
ncbi:minor capsid protein [Aureimonas sp. AU40]|uniref:minor capsid protein n=1 Tax=Aureimonas sp. AU40 TaxID=1637747 RepID=UPI000784287B|nr:minor capsid protein [Aureimonas sp. AU40]